MRIVFFDTETALIAPGMAAPWCVCVQACVDDGDPVVLHVRDEVTRNLVEEWLRYYQLVGQNVAFDMAVICAQWPDLTPLVFKAYAEDRVTCTTIRAKLIDIARGSREKNTRYDLGTLARRFADVAVDKEDPWRMRYAELISIPVDAWPEEARAYALLDAAATRAVYQGQEQYSDLLLDQYRQSRAAFAIRLMECWGFAVDGAQAERYIAKVREGLDKDRLTIVAEGLLKKDGVKDTKKAMARMVELALAQGEPIPLTDGGEALGLPALEVWQTHGKYIALDEETVEDLGDVVLEAYQRFSTAGARIARAERLLLAARAGKPIQASFDTLVRTGRTSCRTGDTKGNGPPSSYGYQMQNPPRAKGQRECFIPRPGKALVVLDFPSLELRTWAQCCIEEVGISELAEILNAKRDPHTELGAALAGIDKETAYRWKKAGGDEWLDFDHTYRYFAKKGNFMFPGGGGAPRFCVALVKDACQTGNVEIIRKAREYTVADAKKLRLTWMDTLPEARLWFDWVNRQLAGNERCTIKFRKSERYKGGNTYCQTANAPFQARGADIKKEVLWRVQQEAYTDRTSELWGSRMVNELHDEIILESPLDRAAEAGWRLREIMTKVGEDFCPDVRFGNAMPEPTLCDRWSKDAKPTKDENGRLTVCRVSL